MLELVGKPDNLFRICRFADHLQISCVQDLLDEHCN